MKLLEEYNISFKKNSLINTALTHSSYANEHNIESYERLEYLGDAVLELIMSDYLFRKTDLPEGKMSRLRSTYVCENALYEYSKKINLASYIKLGNGIKDANKTVVADTLEAVIGVIYLEMGYNECKRLFEELIVPFFDEENDFLHDYKTMLQELVQTDKKSLTYKIVKEIGPPHNRTFTVEVIIDNIVYGYGTGKSKKQAEQNAAKNAYLKQAK